MVRQNIAWLTIIVLGVLLAGCGANPKSEVSQGKAIEGLSEAAWIFKAEQKTALSQPLVTDNYTYFGSDTTLYAIDTKTGDKQWSISIQGIPSTPFIEKDHLLFYDNKGLHAVSVKNGGLIWEKEFEQEMPDGVRPSTVFASSTSVFYVDSLSLKVLDTKTGEEGWKLEGVSLLNKTLILDNGNIIFAESGSIHILEQETGEETKTLTTEMLVYDLAVNKDSIFAVQVGNITSFDKKNYEQRWQYSNESFELLNLPSLKIVNDILVGTDTKTGIMVGLDIKSGEELWNIQQGNNIFSLSASTLITQPSVLENTLYIGAWSGEHEKYERTPTYSDLIAIDSKTGKELWRQKVDSFIMYSPSFINGQTIITNMNETITAYKEGKAPKQSAPIESETSTEKSAANISSAEDHESKDVEYELKDFEGDWRSDKQSISITFKDSENGVISYSEQGEDYSMPFEYKMSSYNELMLMVGADKKPTLLILYSRDSLGYRDNDLRDTLSKEDIPQNADDSVASLISGFEGDWCDSMQAFCFRLELTDVNRGTLEYYQDLDPFKEEFKITYMDEFSVEIEVEGAKQATLSLSSDKNNLTYDSEVMNESMIRQQ